MTVHPDYSSENYLKDIALLKLTIPFGLTDNVNEVCLFYEDFDFNNCIAPGYNINQFGNEILCTKFLLKKIFIIFLFFITGIDVLELVKLSTIDSVECQSALDKSVIGKEFHTNQELMCAKKVEKVDVCLVRNLNQLLDMKRIKKKKKGLLKKVIRITVSA